MMQESFCRAAKELVFGFIRAVGAKHQTINGMLSDKMLDFDHWPTCHHHGFIGYLGSELTLTEDLQVFVCFYFKALLQFGERCIRVVNACEVRQVVHDVDHE